MPSTENQGQGGGAAPLTQYKIDGPKLYLNGFPKSGLHLLWSWALMFVAKPAFMPKPWAASFIGNCWTTRWTPDEYLYSRLGQLAPGTWLKGHCGYREDIDDYMHRNGFIHLFIYRDPRDVAVSQVHHIINANEKRGEIGKILYHPGANDIKRAAKDDFDRILDYVIQGFGPWAGLIERWELYAPWLDIDWVFKMRFEDMRQEPYEVAKFLIRYVYGRMARLAGFTLTLWKEDLEAGADELLKLAEEKRGASPTFRKGEVGGWREAFKPEHIELWKEHDPTDWVTRLGYEW